MSNCIVSHQFESIAKSSDPCNPGNPWKFFVGCPSCGDTDLLDVGKSADNFLHKHSSCGVRAVHLKFVQARIEAYIAKWRVPGSGLY